MSTSNPQRGETTQAAPAPQIPIAVGAISIRYFAGAGDAPQLGSEVVEPDRISNEYLRHTSLSGHICAQMAEGCRVFTRGDRARRGVVVHDQMLGRAAVNEPAGT